MGLCLSVGALLGLVLASACILHGAFLWHVGAWPGVPRSRGLCGGHRCLLSPCCLLVADSWLEAGHRAGERGCAGLLLGQPRVGPARRLAGAAEYGPSVSVPPCNGGVVGATKEAGMLGDSNLT